MKSYIFDLDGTLGVFETDDAILVRPGTKEALNYLAQQSIPFAIATRGPREYAHNIVRKLIDAGIDLGTRILTKEDVQLPNPALFSYKDLSKAYRALGVTAPEHQTVIIGDFLRFKSGEGYSIDDYLAHDFANDPSVLTQRSALNDHPFPADSKTPVYAVVPQPWTTQDKDGTPSSVTLTSVIDKLEQMYENGRGSFARGFEMTAPAHDQQVFWDGLARRTGVTSEPQRYAVMKTPADEWKPLERIS